MLFNIKVVSIRKVGVTGEVEYELGSCPLTYIVRTLAEANEAPMGMETIRRGFSVRGFGPGRTNTEIRRARHCLEAVRVGNSLGQVSGAYDAFGTMAGGKEGSWKADFLEVIKASYIRSTNREKIDRKRVGRCRRTGLLNAQLLAHLEQQAGICSSESLASDQNMSLEYTPLQFQCRPSERQRRT